MSRCMEVFRQLRCTDTGEGWRKGDSLIFAPEFQVKGVNQDEGIIVERAFVVKGATEDYATNDAAPSPARIRSGLCVESES